MLLLLFRITHRFVLLGGLAAALASPAGAALGDARWVTFTTAPDAVSLVADGQAAPLLVDPADWPGVQRAAADVAADVVRVTGVQPVLVTDGKLSPAAAPTKHAVIVGTLGRSALLDQLVAAGKIDVTALRGKWESFLLQTVEAPLPGIERALVIAGSDKRGTIFGLYTLSEQIGVSPWYWWADVPATPRTALAVPPLRHLEPEPVVKYRGIFLNDEAPALAGWARAKFGDLNSQFYAHVFELLLRLRANFLWPAMWDNAFAVDDPRNAALADEYGIVMSTSHHEPMMRAHKEWDGARFGAWNYATNDARLREFWTGGVQRHRDFESMITLGMRGDGDEPMSPEANVALLERIVTDQRAIIAREHARPPAQVPQVWALYKEVQEYFEKGMRVPDDVTLLWCDDNWGNIRRLPTPEERTRSGGAGVYYHFDYVGGPRNYKWVNTVPLPKIWEQMHLAWRHDANRIWIVNVGDLKPMEFPIEFFLTYARDPARWPHTRLGEFGRLWAAREFGAEHATEIAALVAAYTKFHGRRKPEQLEPDTYSLLHYREAERVLAAWQDLAARAERLHATLPAERRDAFHHLVRHPAKAGAIVQELYVTTGRNRLHAAQGRASTNQLAARARELFAADAALTRFWNEEFAAGRWRHFMDQTHLGYTMWQQPPRNVMPAVAELQPSAYAEMGVAVEGSAAAWPNGIPGHPRPQLPPLSALAPGESRFIEIFNRGLAPFACEVSSSEPWLIVSPTGGDVGAADLRVEVSTDRAKLPPGATTGFVTVRGPRPHHRPDQPPVTVRIAVPVEQPARIAGDGRPLAGFIETAGHIAIEAPHYHRAITADGITWETLADFGRTTGGVTAFPVTAPSRTLGPATPRLEYDVHLFTAKPVQVRVVTAPTLAYQPDRGVRYAISFDDEPPQVVDLQGDRSSRAWERSVSEGVHQAVTTHAPGAGARVLKLWMIDPGVVLQRIVIDAGGVRPSYLGPPESPHVAARP